LLTLIPSIGWLLGLIGFILVLLAIKYISDSLADRSIFNNMIISVIAAITGVIIGGLFIVATVYSVMGFHWSGSSLVPNVSPSQIPTGDIIGMIVAIVGGLAVVWACFIVSAIFLRRSYRTLSTKLNVSMFGTAAMLYLVGAVTTIIIIGFVILIIAEILQIVAFFSMSELPPPPPSPPP
jgi:uncharacterized membrane protein